MMGQVLSPPRPPPPWQAAQGAYPDTLVLDFRLQDRERVNSCCLWFYAAAPRKWGGWGPRGCLGFGASEASRDICILSYFSNFLK